MAPDAPLINDLFIGDFVGPGFSADNFGNGGRVLLQCQGDRLEVAEALRQYLKKTIGLRVRQTGCAYLKVSMSLNGVLLKNYI